MINKHYYTIDSQCITCTSPTPEQEVMPFVSYSLTTIRNNSARLIKATKHMAVKKLITLAFAEIIITAITESYTR